jgi:DNA-binding transcriptional LysR family regulator
VSIGTEQCLAVIDLPKVLARFRTVHPGVEIRLRQAGSSGLLEEVRTGGLDLAFVALSGGRTPAGVSLTPLTSEPMMLVCHPDHPLALRDAVDWAHLQDETFVDFHADWGARQVTDRAFGAAGLERQVALEVNDVHSLLDFVAEDLGVALVPRPIAYKKNKNVRAVPLRQTAPSWVVSVAVPVNGRANPATDALLGIVEESTAAQPVAVPGAAGAIA